MVEIVGTGAAPAYFRLDGNGRIVITDNLMRETRTTYDVRPGAMLIELQSTLDISNSDISNSAKL